MYTWRDLIFKRQIFCEWPFGNVICAFLYRECLLSAVSFVHQKLHVSWHLYLQETSLNSQNLHNKVLQKTSLCTLYSICTHRLGADFQAVMESINSTDHFSCEGLCQLHTRSNDPLQHQHHIQYMYMTCTNTHTHSEQFISPCSCYSTPCFHAK